MFRRNDIVPCALIALCAACGATEDPGGTGDGGAGGAGGETSVSSGPTGGGGGTQTETLQWEISPVSFGGDVLRGATVCYENQCEITADSGSVTLDVPKDELVVLTIDHPLTFATTVPLRTGTKNGTATPLVFSTSQIESNLNGITLDPEKGHLVQAVIGPQTVVSLDPASGEGPTYGNALVPDPELDAIPDGGDSGYGVFNVDPGEVTVSYENTPSTCAIDSVYWPIVDNAMRVPIVAGRLTFGIVVCDGMGEQ